MAIPFYEEIVLLLVIAVVEGVGSWSMKGALIRYQQTGTLHFITFNRDRRLQRAKRKW
jgi:hypothetical protein